ncbi:mitogen-activated protein kinase kinase kinase 13 isoform X2 [Tribolium castaneum]|uniref:mitogen-activated protein kinase kinase kinase 13 isoform X2 n=1 Tax=Tribolium castaneum TaxID=7070 RepID=UPI00077DA6BC|nr:PREDICTED: mitogen-activated protein kinase kinase kinase 13 isoform X2 [Tribolium castaneum]|eukprot:XP_015833522.1 PREDICTED: mitogen-activated protein kinase kinase kinase 13 isoform X2 [Tribolium castaneum]
MRNMNYPIPVTRFKEILDQILTSPLPVKWGDSVTLQECVVRLQNELNNFSLHKSASEPTMVATTIPQPQQDSSPDTPQPAPYDLNKGWMTGIFGCLRPVLSIIGKGAVSEIKNSHQDDWEIPFEQITDLTYLGSGGQGTVFSGMLNNQKVAVKKVYDIKETDIRNLKKLNHPNIVKFKGVCTQLPCLSIIMEYCPYGPLFNLLKNQKNVVTINRVVSWAKQITSGMHYLHSQKIIHRDLKSPNVLIGEEEVIKISDFGTSRTWSGVSEKMSFAGTVAWMAPEAIKELECSEKVDIWSFGVVLWELLTCEVPYDGMEQSAIMYMVGCGKLRPPIPKTCPDGFRLIMEMCWKLNPKERPSFKLILNHLQIASVEILGKYEDNQFFQTQESWKEEIKSQITQFKAQLQKHRIEFQLKEEQLIKKRENEIKHVRDIRELYDRKLEKVHQLYLELSAVLQQVEQYNRQGGRKRDIQKNRRLINPFVRKMERRRSNHSTTPTSPECSLTSPDSPQTTPVKAPLFAKLNTATNNPESVTQSSQKFRKRHYRTNSGSPRNSKSSNRSSSVVDAETQTDSMDLSETELSPSFDLPVCITSKRVPQRVVLHELKAESDDEGCNGNVQLRYVSDSHDTEVEVFSRRHSESLIYDQEDTLNQNDATRREFSDEDNLETLGRKVSALKNGNIFTDIQNSAENGNVTDLDVLRKNCACSAQDSTEDACNDSFTDEEGEVYNNTLWRKSKLGKDLLKLSSARRPIYPVRRSNRTKSSLNFHQKQQLNGSDEGDTSEYSVSPSSKSSTLESNPDRAKAAALKRPNEKCSSDSESDQNVTIVTQVSYKSESVV